MDVGTIVALATLALSILGSVVWLAQRDGKSEARMDAFVTKGEFSSLRERLSLSEAKHDATNGALAEMKDALADFRADMKDTLREHREEVRRLVEEKLR